MSSRTLELNDRLYEYLLAHTLREPPLMARLRAETAKLTYGTMQISPEQGQLMALLIEMIGARRALEVGTFTGYSALAVALALPADGRLIACDISEDYTAVGRRYWAEAGVADKIDLRIGPALNTLDSLLKDGAAGSFDFMFIDADKTNYRHYYERGLQLLRQGGLLAVDNVLWSGAVADPAQDDKDTQAIRDLNEAIHADPRVSMAMVPIGDGLTLARKR
jgi:predicted O-methyltransferase YrrM